MIKMLAKKYVGARKPGEVGYYKKLAKMEHKLKEGIIVIAAIILLIVTVVACIYAKVTDKSSGGYWAPDYVTDDDAVIDIDGDGFPYHWVED